MKNKKKIIMNGQVYDVLTEIEGGYVVRDTSQADNVQVVKKKASSRKKDCDKTLWTNFSFNTDRLRHFYGMSERELAKRSGMSQSAIHDILTGKAKPRQSSAEKISKAVGVSIQYLQVNPVAFGRIA